ncbi:MAG: FAD-dependent monooxygenase [Proteobacteria bacterium]|nr:FAD-dependent monooxygenase [Pseudomonadota bacterium]
MQLNYSVIIIGAGPGGASVAARLEQHGHAGRVLVLERYGFPRPKPCGGGLTGHVNEAMAELDLTLSVPHWPADLARVRFGSFVRTVRMARPVNIVRREEFDHSLVEQVRAKGIEVAEGEGVKAIEVTGDAVTVTTSLGRTLRCSVLVGADGAASVTRKYILANARTLPHRLFKMEMALPQSRSIDPAMLYDFTPMVHGIRGYLWVFPLPGRRVNVGVMHYPTYRKSGIELVERLRSGLAELGLSLPARGARGWPAWGYHPRAPISRPRVLTVGDAAGIDGLTGEGISVAMEHAVVAGDAVDQALRTGDMSFSGYRQAIRRAVVGRELALDRWLARLLYEKRGQGWRKWLSLVLYDPDVLDMYAARVSGSEILADQKLRLYRALLRHICSLPGRNRSLRQAMTEMYSLT